MTVTQSSFVSRAGTPAPLSANGVNPAVPLVERCWEPQALFIHDWSQPVTLRSKWNTVVSKSRTGEIQRIGLSDKPTLTLDSESRCFNQNHWSNLNEMLSKQEVCRYLSPLHCDPIHGVTLFDPQYHRFAVTSDLNTRRLFQGQNAMIATVPSTAMTSEFTCSEVTDVNRTTKRITLETPLRRAQYEEPKIDKSIYAVTSTSAIPSGGYGYASGSTVTMWCRKSWTAGNPTTVGSRASDGGQTTSVAGVELVVNSKAQAVLIKPNDQIIHIGYTMARNSQSMTLTPTVIKAVKGAGGATTQVSPTWTLVALNGGVTDWVESGTVGGSTANQPTNFSHQRVGAATPTTAQVRTCRVQVRTTTVTQAMIDTLRAADTGITGNGAAQVYVEATVAGSAGTSTTTDNALAHVVLVVRDGFLKPTGATASLIAAVDAEMMTHLSASAPDTNQNDYPSGASAYPLYTQSISLTSAAPKSKTLAIQFLSYGRSSQQGDPAIAVSSPLAATLLYPTSQSYPDGSSTPSNTNLSRAFVSSSATDVTTMIHEIVDASAVEAEPITGNLKNYGFSGTFGYTSGVPTTPNVTPFLFNLGLVLNPSIQKPLRCYPLMESDPSPSNPQYGTPDTSTIGKVSVSASQSSGMVALDSPDTMIQTGWDYAAYPPFQSNPKRVNSGSVCNTSSDYATTAIVAPLLTGKFDYATGITIGASSSVDMETVGIGRSVEGYQEEPRKEFSVQATFLKRTDAFKFLQLWNNRRGRLAPVWFPNPSDSLNALYSAFDNEIYFAANDSNVLPSITHGAKFIYIRTTGGTSYILSVSGWTSGQGFIVATIDTTLRSDGTQLCNLDPAVASAIQTKTVARITTAHLCYFDNDELTEQWRTDEVMSVQFKLTEHSGVFKPEMEAGVATPTTGCGYCCGSVDPCPCTGGSAFGCPTTINSPNACCICRTSGLKLRVTVFCYDPCYNIEEPDNDPLDCPGCSCTKCTLAGSYCLPTGAKEFELEVSAPDTTCSVLGFRSPAPAACAAGGDQAFTAFLDTRTGQWTVSQNSWIINPCCAGGACQCPPQGCPCATANCNNACGTPKSVSECAKFEFYENICDLTCVINPNCASLKCGQLVGGTRRPLTDCCGKEDPNRPGNAVGRLKVLGELINEWGSIGSTTGCTLACATCT